MKRILIVCLLVLLTGLLFGGDIAAFVNLGFSENSRYLMFGQYGVLEESMQLYADLYTVEVRTNRFVPNGVKNSIFNESLSPGQSGIGALFSLYRSSETIDQQYRINHMKAGRLLYILVNGDKPKDRLVFRDFSGNRSYDVQLIQSQSGTGDSISSSFHINLSVKNAAGKEHFYTVGLPNYGRSGVAEYRIQQILVSPDESSLVFVVEKEETANSGINIRYMVETVYLGN